MSIDERINAKITSPRDQFQKNNQAFNQAQAAIGLADPRDKDSICIAIKAPVSMPLKQFLDNSPTEILYLLQDMIQKVLASRTDSKR